MWKTITLTAATVLAAVIAGTSNAGNLKPTPAWMRQAHCIHRHESVDWHKTTTWTGAPSVDHGGFQIDVGTWASMLRLYPSVTAGYPSDPAWATPWQQYQVAYLIWLTNGHRFGGHQWYLSAKACGVP